jgi:calcium permeable stress-gated cation channel
VDGWINWVYTVLSYSDDQIFFSHGIDALVYMQFMKFCIVLFAFLTLVGLAVLLPTNYFGNTDSKGFNATVFGNIPQGSNLFWVHLCAVYLFTGIIVFAVYRAFDIFVSRAHQYRKLPLPSNYTVMIRKVPAYVRTSRMLKEHFERFFPDQIIGAHLVFDTTRIENLIVHREALKRLLHVAEHERDSTGVHPRHKQGLFGEYVDSIDFYSEELRKLRDQIKVEQLKVDLDVPDPDYKPAGTGFLTLNTLVAANQCAQTVASRSAWQVRIAPTLSDVHWDQLRVSRVHAWSRRLLIAGFVGALIIFWTIPVGVIAQFTNLSYLAKFDSMSPFVKWIGGLPSIVPNFLTRFLPTITLFLVMLLLVPVIRLLVIQERQTTRTNADLSVFRKYYAFLVLNVLLFSSIFSQLPYIITVAAENPSGALLEVATTLGRTLPTFGAFFINYILNSCLAAGAFSLSRIVWFGIHLLQLRFAKTPREKAETKRDAVGGFEYDVMYALHLTILTIVLAYSSMVPIILPATLGYFIIWFIVDKYNTMFVAYEQYDAQGKWSELIYRRVLVALIIYHFTMFGIFLVKGAALPTAFTLPLFALDFYIIWMSNKLLAGKWRNLPLDEAATVSVTARELKFANKYLAPALRRSALYEKHLDPNAGPEIFSEKDEALFDLERNGQVTDPDADEEDAEAEAREENQARMDDLLVLDEPDSESSSPSTSPAVSLHGSVEETIY